MNRRCTNEGRITGNKENRRNSRLGVRIAVTRTVRSPGEFEQMQLCYPKNMFFSAVNVIFIELRRNEDATRSMNFIDKHSVLLALSRSEFFFDPIRKIPLYRLSTIEKPLS